jgi:hypothetical protein
VAKFVRRTCRWMCASVKIVQPCSSLPRPCRSLYEFRNLGIGQIRINYRGIGKVMISMQAPSAVGLRTSQVVVSYEGLAPRPPRLTPIADWRPSRLDRNSPSRNSPASIPPPSRAKSRIDRLTQFQVLATCLSRSGNVLSRRHAASQCSTRDLRPDRTACPGSMSRSGTP